jgi:site-specific DNA-methyltransferase (adenine-specific)
VRPPHLDDGDVRLYLGDCIEVMRQMDAESVDAVVCDPPYGLEFMGKEWDRAHSPAAFAAWCETWAREAYRVLNPGGHLLAFGGTRTFHRLTCGIEDAGFEVRDCLSWLYGSGFPKSLDVSKAIDKAAGAEREVVGKTARCVGPSQDEGYLGTGTFRGGTNDITAPATDAAREWQGWGTALKPAWEPCVVARKPLIGTVAANVQAHGTGALNVDGCRLPVDQADPVNKAVWTSRESSFREGGTGFLHGTTKDGDQRSAAPPPAGRWPANVAFDEDAAAMLDAQSGVTTSGAAGRKGSSGFAQGYDGKWDVPYGDTGGASRFFYTAKASRADRTTGGVANNTHPTVKPTDLMRWLVRLVTPPGGVVLDPFAGSGTTLVAARAEGFRAIGIEREEEYAQIIADRLSQLSLFSETS